MSQTEHLKTLTRYNRWANSELIKQMRALPAGEITKERPALFKTMVRTLNHPLVTDRMWWAHLHGAAHAHKALNEVLYEDFEELAAARAGMDEDIIAYADALNPDAAEEEVGFTLLSGVPGRMSRAMILFHMVNHNTYHRGFVVEAFCQIPAPLPLIDLPVFMRGAGDMSFLPPHLKGVKWNAQAA